MELDMLMPPSAAEMARASGIAKTAAADWSAYSRACKRRFDVIVRVLDRLRPADLEGRRALDWGSAVGGVAILLERNTPLSVTAADIDPHSINWLSRAGQGVSTALLKPGAPLPFETGAFDIIYGLSVLTHIPPQMQDFYLGELRRVAKSDAIVILTIKSYKAVEHNKKENRNPDLHPHTREQLDAAGIIYASYPDRVLSSMDLAREADYGVTYHSATYVDENFGVYFEVDRADPQWIGNQDVLVLRPKSA